MLKTQTHGKLKQDKIKYRGDKVDDKLVVLV